MKQLFIFIVLFLLSCSLVQAKTRTWTTTDGKGFDAEYLSIFGDKVVLKLKTGKKVRIPMDKLSPSDKVFVERLNPPRLDINFTHTKKQRKTPLQAESAEKHHPSPKMKFVTFHVSVKKKSSASYSLPLTVEYFAFADEINGDKKILVAHETKAFSFKGKNREYTFQGKTVEFMRYIVVIGTWEKGIHLPPRGERYGGFVVIVRDQSGKVIAHKSSNKNLYKVIDKIAKLHEGCYFDPTTGLRTYPSRPDHFPKPSWLPKET